MSDNGGARLVGLDGKRIPTEADRAQFEAGMRQAQAEIRFGRLALQAVAVFLQEKKSRKRTIPKETTQAIVGANLNLVIREDAENLYLELQEPEPVEQEGTDGSDR